VLILCVFSPAPVFSQSQSGGCTIEPIGGTSRQRIVCRDGLSIVVEPGARYTLLSRSGGRNVDAVRLKGKALLLDFKGRGAPSGVEVLTPQAIAAVRGTRWVVDVAKASTSVFVIAGRVEVRRSNGADAVSLQPGEGVDVGGGSGALTVKHWPASRVNALLSRLGQ
jgi:ferric-dicitrate binding protein FerR (iron transport regulator)